METLTSNLDLLGLPECPDLHTSVVVIGGGMAGSWVAYQLAKAGVETILVTYRDADRDGLQGSSRRSAGAFSSVPLSETDLASYLQNLGRGQTHPSVAPALLRYFPQALEELRSLVRLKLVKVGYVLESGGGEAFLGKVQERFSQLGGVLMNGWVTQLWVSRESCRGVQYECSAGIGRIRCNAVVIAAGGYAGLFRNAIRTQCFGNMLGAIMERGGFATNLEFLFKHGYGNVDAHVLTPTEELPGAEVYDKRHDRVAWLEQLLFQRQGTRTHLQAVQHWLRNPENEYYVDLSYRPLFLKLCALHAVMEQPASDGRGAEETRVLSELADLFPGPVRASVLEKLQTWVQDRRGLSYYFFEELKPLLGIQALTRFRVRPLTYFSMGGIGHREFRTNLHNTYVTGEAMHDFGANRVGGLPWSLYLASGCAIAEQVVDSVGRSWEPDEGFDLVRKPTRFDGSLLHAIQQRLHESQEMELTAAGAEKCIAWLRDTRRRLREDTGFLHDGIAWLIAAEAIMVSSSIRAESRGFFFRFDYQEEDRRLDGLHSFAWFDAVSDSVSARLLPVEEILQIMTEGGDRADFAYGSLLPQHC